MAKIKITRDGDWQQAREILDAAPKDIPRVVGVAIKQEAHFLAGKVKERLRTGPFTPKRSAGGRNAKGQYTGGGSKPLNKTGALKQSITAIVRDNEAFIGISRGAPGHGGKVHDLAMVHEFGALIVMAMTAKQRRFLFGVLFKGKTGGGGGSGTGILVIKIPARPFIRPTFEDEAPQIPERFYARLAKALGGKLGAP